MAEETEWWTAEDARREREHFAACLMCNPSLEDVGSITNGESS